MKKQRFQKKLLLLQIFLFVSKQVIFGQSVTSTIPVPECIDGASTWYNGTHSYTESGILCQRWDVTKPHKPNHIPADGGKHNYCRNPDGDLSGTWCYTTNQTKRWEYCYIPKCSDDSLVVWTNYDATSESSHILSVHADPEIVKNQTGQTGHFNVSILVKSNDSVAEFWSVTGNYHRNVLFYTDYRSEYIGVRHLKHDLTLKMYEGMAHGIESMAYDWMTRNLYWTDSEFKWVMASENSFRYYTPVYRTDDPPYALAIHAKHRQLYFSTYKALKSKIIVTDMAGKNETVLFQFPDVFDVTGLTIDYTDERLYWTDFTGYGGMVVSSKLDGTNKTQHHYRGGSIFWGVAAYLDYLYVTDVHARYSPNSQKYYSVWIITKKTKKTFRYTLNGKPRGIAVLSKNEERDPLVNDPKHGRCNDPGVPKCAHICLPRINATRECACSLGYHKVDETKCQSSIINDEFILIADSGQGKIFQLPIGNAINTTSNYSIYPAPTGTSRVATVAADTNSNFVFWSDKQYGSIKKALLDGTRKKTLSSASHSESLVVDPISGNVFFMNSESESISVMSYDGQAYKTLMTSESINASIKMVTQDSVNRKIYWTDTNNTEGQGQVWRMNLDGTKKEVVLSGLNWPHAITINHERKKLYVAEAKTAMIYEVDLDSIKTIISTSPQDIKKQFDLAGHITRLEVYIKDIKVHRNNLYLIDDKTFRVEKFSLETGPSSLTSFGPSEFFALSSMTLVSKEYYKSYIATIPSPCKRRSTKCHELCVDISDTESKCICGDGKRLLSTACVNDGLGANKPPSTNYTCPDNVNLDLPQCESFTFTNGTWSEPTWIDDSTPVDSLFLRRPSIPVSLGAGRHSYIFSATDAQGLTGYCSFTITVKSNECNEPPQLPASMVAGKRVCDNRFGSSYSISCKDGRSIKFVGANPPVQTIYNQTTVVNYCGRIGWLITDASVLVCEALPTPLSTISTTSKSTSQSTTSSTTSKATPSPATPKTTFTTSKAKTSKTTTTPSTEQKITSKTSKPETPKKPTLGTPPKTAMAPTATTTAASATVNGSGNVQLTGKQSSSGGMGSGALAAIIVLVVLLVIIVAVVVVVTLRKRGTPWLTSINFPYVWRASDDTDNIYENDSNRVNNHYSVM
ncbi:low-density lipoprotein receptor-related protein 2-like isoform X1 [Clavelina lepadiformis]|uniref:low-density lipoprotein receptor-related protein 2-like isoform X1 n=1 Tax=Clavelina lepadiformis TaxID=159417 RepID=UPI00404153F0